MPDKTKGREELISSLSTKLFSAMLQEVIIDTTLQSHKDIIRGKAICPVCGMRCGSSHAQEEKSDGTSSSNDGLLLSVPLRTAGSPPSTSVGIAGTSTPTAKEKNDGNIYFECTNCQKKIASNRYAPHLSGCLGIGTGSRRGAARNAAAKNKLGPDAERTESPLVGSDFGSPSFETINGKVKGKIKNTKKIQSKAIEIELNGNHKRPSTPGSSPAKKNKKKKTSAVDLDTTIVGDDNVMTKPHTPMATKKPVKLGVASASPDAPGSPSGTSGSHYSGRDSPSGSVSVSSVNAHSPTTGRGSKLPTSYKPKPGIPLKKQGRPPASGTNQITAAEATATNQKSEEDPDFIDVDGEDQEESSSDSP